MNNGLEPIGKERTTVNVESCGISESGVPGSGGGFETPTSESFGKKGPDTAFGAMPKEYLENYDPKGGPGEIVFAGDVGK